MKAPSLALIAAAGESLIHDWEDLVAQRDEAIAFSDFAGPTWRTTFILVLALWTWAATCALNAAAIWGIK